LSDDRIDYTPIRRQLLADLVPFRDACRALQVTERTGYKYLAAGWLVAVKVGQRNFVDIKRTRERLLGTGR
jgi:hypothetical protein